MEDDPTPPLYKYTSIDSAARVLANSTLKYSCPLVFNDPMDVRTSVFHGHVNAEKLWTVIRDLYLSKMKTNELDPDKFPTPELIELLRRACEYASDKDKSKENQRLKYERELIETFSINFSQSGCVDTNMAKKLRHIHVCCFSSLHPTNPDGSPENQLMWGHYAEQHKGVAVGFDFSKLTRQRPLIVEYETVISKPTNEPLLAEYLLGLNDNPPFTFTPTTLLCTKSSCWKYESEWRDIVGNDQLKGDVSFHEFYPARIASIHIGVRCIDSDRKVIEILARDYSNPTFPI